MQIQNEKIKAFDASLFRVGIVVSRFNQEITGGLLKEARAELARFRVAEKNVAVVSVPGSVEMPFALDKLARTKRFDCLVALGAIIRGETDHYAYVCKMAQEGVLRVMLDHHTPVGFGVLTVENEEQARKRLAFGAAAAAAALELAALKI